MPKLIPDSCCIQAVTLRIYFGLAFVGLAVAAHQVHSEEGSFVAGLDMLTIQPVQSEADFLPPYQYSSNVVLTPSPDTAPIGSGFGSTSTLSSSAKPKQEATWTINSYWQQSHDGGRVSLPRLLHVEFNVEQVKVTLRPKLALFKGERFKIMLQPHSALMLWSKAF